MSRSFGGSQRSQYLRTKVRLECQGQRRRVAAYMMPRSRSQGRPVDFDPGIWRTIFVPVYSGWCWFSDNLPPFGSESSASVAVCAGIDQCALSSVDGRSEKARRKKNSARRTRVASRSSAPFYGTPIRRPPDSVRRRRRRGKK